MQWYKQYALRLHIRKQMRTKPHIVLSDNFLKELVSVCFQPIVYSVGKS